MLRYSGAFTSFSVKDLKAAKEFYSSALGLSVAKTPEGLSIDLGVDGKVFIYPKSDHAPATYTVLNFKVEDIDQAVEELRSSGVTLESFEGDIETDASRVFRGREQGKGPDIAWFRDPAGNYLSILREPNR